MMLSSRSRCRGAMQVHEKRPDAVMVFMRRRRSRNSPTVCADAAPRTKPRCRSVWKRRRASLAQQDKPDYVVVNDTVERAVEELHGILAKRR